MSPYQPIAEAAISTGGGFAAASMALISAVVLSIRLVRSSCLRAGVQPAAGDRGAGQMHNGIESVKRVRAEPPLGAAGSQRISPGPDGGRRTSRTTSMPSALRLWLSALPMSPVDAVIAIRMCRPFSPA